MTTRSEREKAQKLNEQHQTILTKLLREDDNKYCADCEAKGPRWASWNLGVFMCIRCAGIHRNLGVHISRVKSVNLDQWTPEQIQSMIDMGNQRAKRLYEAHLPEGFRRPQTDQSVEVFIRDKYDRKKYYDQEALATITKSSEAAPASSSPSSSQADRTRLEKKEEKKKERDADKQSVAKMENISSPKESSQPAVDLLGLDTPVGGAKSSGGGPELDIFGPMVSNPLPSSGSTQQTTQSASAAAPQQAAPTSTSATSSSTTSSSTKTEQKKLLSKDSILSLYASSPVASQTHNQQQQQTASGQAPLYGTQFPAQGFGPGIGGPAPPTTMIGGGAMIGVANGSYIGVQQQGQWGVAQMTQQMSGMAVSGGVPSTPSSNQSGGPGAPTTTWAAAPPASSGQTLSTQLWK